MANRRAKGTKIWASGVSIFSVYRVLLTAKSSMFSLGSFGAFLIFAGLVHVSRKRLIVERNGPKFGVSI